MGSALRAGRVAPPWRLLLLSDGSVTRHLQILAGTVPLAAAAACAWAQRAGALCAARGCCAAAHAGSQKTLRGRERAGCFRAAPRLTHRARRRRADVDAAVEVIAQQAVPPAGGATSAAAAEWPLPEECALLTPPLLQRQARVA